MRKEATIQELKVIRDTERYELNDDKDKAEITITAHSFMVGRYMYIIDGIISIDIWNYEPGTREYPEEYEIADTFIFDGSIAIYDQDGEEIYYDELILEI